MWILFVEYQLFRYNTFFFYDVKDSINDTNIIWKPKNSSKTIFRLLLREGDQLLLAFWVEMFPFQKRWYTSSSLIERSENRPMKMTLRWVDWVASHHRNHHHHHHQWYEGDGSCHHRNHHHHHHHQWYEGDGACPVWFFRPPEKADRPLQDERGVLQVRMGVKQRINGWRLSTQNGC